MHDKKGDQFAVVGRMDYISHVRSKITKEINIKGDVFDYSKSENPDWLGEGTMWSNQDIAIKYDEDSPKSTAKHHVWDVDMDELNSYMSLGRPGNGNKGFKKTKFTQKGDIVKGAFKIGKLSVEVSDKIINNENSIKKDTFFSITVRNFNIVKKPKKS